MNLEEIKKQARKEIEEDDYRQAVDKYKEKLRDKRKFWNKVFPWKIIIIRKDQNV